MRLRDLPHAIAEEAVDDDPNRPVGPD